MDVERLRFIDVTRPEETEIIVSPRRASRNTGEGHLDRAVLEQLIAHPTFETPIRSGRLIQLGGVIVDRAKFHRRVARLEENFPVECVSVVNVLKVQTGISGNE